MELPVRKHPRLDEYDYSQNGYYFITICVKDRRRILSNISVGRDAHIPPKVILTDIGTIVDEYIGNINKAYNNIAVDSYVIMPDHIHLLVSIDESSYAGGMKASRPTLNTVVRSLKTMVTKKIGYSIWQSSYYDHIIRNKEDLFETRKYIENNPIRWICKD